MALNFDLTERRRHELMITLIFSAKTALNSLEYLQALNVAALKINLEHDLPKINTD